MDSLYSQIGNLPFFTSGKGQKVLLRRDDYIEYVVKNSRSIVRFPMFDLLSTHLQYWQQFYKLNYDLLHAQLPRRILKSSQYANEPEFIEHTNKVLLSVLATITYCVEQVAYRRSIVGYDSSMFMACPRITDSEVWVSVGMTDEQATDFIRENRSAAKKAIMLCAKYGVNVKYKEIDNCITFVVSLDSFADYKARVEQEIEYRLNPRPPVEFNFDDPLEGLEYAD